MRKRFSKAASVFALCGAATATHALNARAAAAEPAPAAAKPNVLFIMADDLGWRDTAVYGSTYYQTPHIDALAASGMRFTDAYAANPLCSPTRASILTGQYPVRIGLTTASGHIEKLHKHAERTTGPEEVRAAGPSGLNYLDPKHFTLGKAMKQAGYATGFFGKWHMGCRMEHYPESHGFDYVRGGRRHPGPPGKNPARKFFPPWNCETLDSNVPADTHVDDYIADLAIDYMTRQHEAGKPFFVCYWAYSVHAPFQSKPELVAKWKRRPLDPKNPQRSPTMGAMIEVLDSNVGRLTKALKDLGVDGNTIVIFTSDNGGNMYNTVDGTTPTNNAPLKTGKGNNYEGGVRVPLIVRWPGVTKAGSVNHSVVSSVDHYPAILDMTGQAPRPDDHKDGVSYTPALRGEPFDRGPTLCDFPHPVWATYNIPNTSLRMGDWKLYRFWYDDPADQSHRYELYNLADDIGETKNLAEANPQQRDRMIAAIDGYYERSGVLTYHPNARYNHRTVGTWYAASDAGSVAADNGALVITADRPNFTVRNRFVPGVGTEGAIVFEARSPTRSTIAFARPTGNGKQSVAISTDWREHRLTGKQVSLNRDRFAVTLGEAGRVELRNVRVVANDGTEMMRYRFY